MPPTGYRVSVGITPTPLHTRDDNDYTSLMIQNLSGVTVYIGGSDMTTAIYGHALADKGTLSVRVPTSGVLYARVEAATADVNVLAVKG